MAPAPAPTPVTELAFLTLKPGVQEKLSQDTLEAKAWSKALTTISEQQGYQRLRWGVTLEDPSLLMLLIDWDTLTAHQNFVSSPSYITLKAALSTITTSVHLFHTTPSSFPPLILHKAPVIEFAVFYGGEESLMKDMGKFVAVLEDNKASIDGYMGSTWGESLEEVVKHSEQGKGGGKEARAVVLWIGWESKEKHLAFRETELFKENIHWIRGNHQGVELWHVKFTAF